MFKRILEKKSAHMCQDVFKVDNNKSIDSLFIYLSRARKKVDQTTY
jgi:hypothetical protein